MCIKNTQGIIITNRAWYIKIQTTVYSFCNRGLAFNPLAHLVDFLSLSTKPLFFIIITVVLRYNNFQNALKLITWLEIHIMVAGYKSFFFWYKNDIRSHRGEKKHCIRSREKQYVVVFLYPCSVLSLKSYQQPKVANYTTFPFHHYKVGYTHF